MSVDVIDLAFRLVATGFAVWLAYRSFQRRSIQLGDEPTLPQYFVRRGVYLAGSVTYVALVAGGFFAMFTMWLPLQPLLEAIAENWRSGNLASLFLSLDESHVLPLIVAGAALALIGWESKLNPVLILRDTIYDASAIPRRAVEVYEVLRHSRLAAVPREERQRIIALPIVPNVDLDDFDKSSASVEYRWARNCMLFDKIQTYAAQPSFARLFAEPSLKWGDICIAFNRVSEMVTTWKRGPTHYTRTLQLMDELDSLNRRLCRLLAGLVIFEAGSERELWNTVVRLGGSPNRARLKHTWKYVLTFAAAMVIGVIVGREMSVLLYNTLVDGESSLRHFAIDTFRWIVYASSIYILPLVLVFAARLTSFRIMASEETRFYGFYTFMIVLGFFVSTSFSALVLGLSASTEFDFIASFVASMRWGILPAMLCGLVAYQMDSPVPDSEPKGEMYLRGGLRFVIWGVVAMVIMLYATDDLRVIDPELRFTVVVTSTFMVGAIAAVARFKTIQSYIGEAPPADDDSSTGDVPALADYRRERQQG